MSSKKILNNYQIQKCIGGGSFGEVYLVKSLKDPNNYYALKQIDFNIFRNSNDYRRQVDEINILFFNSSPNLLHGVDIEYDRLLYKLNIILDLYKGGNLENFINTYRINNKKIPSEMIWNIFKQISMGIYYLHKNNVIHRDLKPSNILLDNKDDPKNVVICDFGASICLNENIQNCQTKIGTPYFMSPEQYDSKYYDKKTDIWSLGCILYELITLEKPFTAANICVLRNKIAKGIIKKINYDINDNILNLLNELIYKMIEIDSNKRITINQIFDFLEKRGVLNFYYPNINIPVSIKNMKVINSIQFKYFIDNIKIELENKIKNNIYREITPRYNILPKIKYSENIIKDEKESVIKLPDILPVIKPSSAPVSVKENISYNRKKSDPELVPIGYANRFRNRIYNYRN